MATRIVSFLLAGTFAFAAPTLAPAATSTPTPAATSDVADLDAARHRIEQLTDAKDFTTALDEAKKLDAIVRSRFGTTHTHYAVTLNVIARVHYGQGKYDEAEKLYRQALKIREDADGPNNAKTENTLIGLANSLYSQRKYAEAEPFYLRALALRERAVGTSHPSLISLLINIGDDYRLQKKHAPAEEPYRRALALREK